MLDSENNPQSSPSASGHPLPRRAPAEKSVTIQNHRLAREASQRSQSGDSRALSLPRRNSSDESHDTGQTDPRKWFDRSNCYPGATLDNSNTMDVDPPFYQRQTDSLNEDLINTYAYHHPKFRSPMAPPNFRPSDSSSVDEYRSVIDDLTIENQKLREQLRHYKQAGPETLKNEKLFEIKFYSLSRRKRGELEETLRDFAASLGSSTPSADLSGSLSQRKNNSSRQRDKDRLNSSAASGSMSKLASSSAGSNTQPLTSAYASNTTEPNSSGTSLTRPTVGSSARSSHQKVRSYLRDIPEGLCSQPEILTVKERQRMVVRRLERIFTGQTTGRMPEPLGKIQTIVPEPAREAMILPRASGSGANNSQDKRGHSSTSHSSGNQGLEGHHVSDMLGGAGARSGSGPNNPSPPTVQPAEQRPTRPHDLDPDRVQVPADNMEYIRHLGLVPPQLLPGSHASMADVAPDVDGWVYLNLVCNLAQLHMLNVSPAFIRTAVTEMSTKFQLSRDGDKIRWRGGCEGTKFSSESSGDNSQTSPLTDETDGSNKGGQRKRSTAQGARDDKTMSDAGKRAQAAKLGPSHRDAKSHVGQSKLSAGFRYQPMFTRRSSSRSVSMDGTESSGGDGGSESADGGGLGGQGQSGSSPRKKRRIDGAVIYYSGAPFCTDLSGDPGDTSSTTCMMSGSNDRSDLTPPPPVEPRGLLRRTTSGSSLQYKPLSDGLVTLWADKDHAADGSSLDDPDDGGDGGEMKMVFPWSDSQQPLHMMPLEPSGLGGILPEDNFMVVVSTRRPRIERPILSEGGIGGSMTEAELKAVTAEEQAGTRTDRLASIASTLAVPGRRQATTCRHTGRAVDIEYLSGRIKRLNPEPLPLPALFFPPSSSDTSCESDIDFGDLNDLDSEQNSRSWDRMGGVHAGKDADDDAGEEDEDETEEEPEDEMVVDEKKGWRGLKRGMPKRSDSGDYDV